MKRWPVYRWGSFWLGIFVLVFFAWAWVWSMAHEKFFGWGLGGTQFDIGVDEGSFSVLERPRWAYGMGMTRAEMDDVIAQPEWAFLRKEKAAGAMWWIVFPMWVPMMGWLAVWGGWLVWLMGRWRRVMRLTEMDGEGRV